MSSSATGRHPSPARTGLILAAAIAIAVALNALVAAVAVGAGAPASFAPLNLPVHGAFAAAGVIAGWAGWRTVHRRAARPGAVLRVLVPAVMLVSFVPDLALMALRFIPDTTTAGALALMAMHLVVLAVALPGYLLASRPARTRTVAPTAS